MTKLFRIERSKYTDQHGFEHECWEILEEVEVEPTGEYYEYEYYSETIRNPKYRDAEGRDWTCMVATDYGGSSSWSRYENGQRVDERWVRNWGLGSNPTGYGMLPLIRKETT